MGLPPPPPCLQTVVNHVKYVDDSSLWEVCGADGGNSLIQVATDQAVEWSARNLMTINAEKTKEMMISFSNKPVAPPPVTINNTAIERTETFKLLGVVLSNKLDWSDHCEYLHTKGSQRLYLLVLLRRAGVPDHDILRIYTSMIRSVLEYAAPVWHRHIPFTGTVREARVSAEEGPSRCVSRSLIPKSPLSDWHADPASETGGHHQGILRAAVTARPQTALPVATAQGHWVQS